MLHDYTALSNEQSTYGEIAMNDETRDDPETQEPAPEPRSEPEPQQAAPPPPPPPSAQAAPPQYAPGAPTQPAQRRNYVLPIAIGAGCLVLLLLVLVPLLIMAAAVSTIGGGKGIGGGNVALIRVTGGITGGKSSADIFGGGTAGAEDLVSQLEKARKDDSIKAIVLRINSPGGSAAGSEEVWREIMRVRKTGKPVYTSMADVAASGGYYIASASDRIFADAATVTGSIGVIYSGADMSELYKKIGFKPETIKSGKFKDTGNPARPLTPEERALIQGIIDNIFAQFVKAVAEGRKMPEAQVRKLADGRVYTGDQALKLKLIDEIGGLRETTLAAAKAGGVKGEPKVTEYRRGGFLGTLLSSDEESRSRVEREMARRMLEELLRRDGLSENLR
jgi:protease-4